MATSCDDMGLRYRDKVAIVTGSSGIGEGVVRVFVRHGAKVVFCSIAAEDGKKLESELNIAGPGQCHFILCDVRKENEIKNVVDKTIEIHGKLDCLVNNVGWHPPEEKIDDVTADQFRSLFDLNVINYFLFAKYCLPHLRKTKGNITNISSLVAKIGQLHAVPYVTTKAAIVGFTKALAVDEAKHGVRVNSVSPSCVWTPLWDELAASTDDAEATIETGREFQLMGRFGTPEEVGQMCLFLAAEATFSTGCDMLITGGAELNYARKTRIQDK